MKEFLNTLLSQPQFSEGGSKKKESQLVIVCTMTEVLLSLSIM